MSNRTIEGFKTPLSFRNLENCLASSLFLYSIFFKVSILESILKRSLIESTKQVFLAIDPIPRHNIRSFRPTGKTCKLTGKTLGFVKAKILTDDDGLWMVSTTSSTTMDKKWITPNCLLKSENGKVPVVNLAESSYEIGKTGYQ